MSFSTGIHGTFCFQIISDPEVARHESLTSAEIINHCKSVFSHYEILDVVHSDNGSQFDPMKVVKFKDFVKCYAFAHISSSPKFP